MTAFDFHPSSYNQIENNTVLEETQENHIKGGMWYKTLTDFHLKDTVATTFATIFNNNAFNFSKIHNLDNDALKSMNIDKTEHCMQSVRMEPSQPDANTIQHSSQHPETKTIDKCHRCKELVCFDCRQQLTLGPTLVTYCDKCVDDVSCTIQ